MDFELKAALADLKERTGIEISLYSEMLRLCISSENGGELPLLPAFEHVFLDEGKDKTYFKVNYKNTALIGVIDGAGTPEKNYAGLFSMILSGSLFKEAEPCREDELKRILLGDKPRTQIQRFMLKYNIPEAACFAVVINADGKKADVISLLLSVSDSGPDTVLAVGENDYAYVKFIDDDGQTPTEFAAFLVQSIYEELGVKVSAGAGGVVKQLTDINVSYQQAYAALRMSKIFLRKGSVHSYREYLLVRILEDLPKLKLREYFDILIDGDARAIFEDEDIINTAEEFLENSLNVSETSRNLFMHRNTLMYRLDKIEKITGLNIRNFTDAVSFRLLTVLFKLLN